MNNQGYGAPPADVHAIPNSNAPVKGGPSTFGIVTKSLFWNLFQMLSAGLLAGLGAILGFCLVIALLIGGLYLFVGALDKYVLQPIKEDAAQQQQMQQQRQVQPPQRQTATARQHKNTGQR